MDRVRRLFFKRDYDADQLLCSITSFKETYYNSDYQTIQQDIGGIYGLYICYDELSGVVSRTQVTDCNNHIIKWPEARNRNRVTYAKVLNLENDITAFSQGSITRVGILRESQLQDVRDILCYVAYQISWFEHTGACDTTYRPSGSASIILASDITGESSDTESYDLANLLE